MIYRIVLGLLLCSNFSCTKNIDDPNVDNNNQPNILLIIADDMGLDACPGYDIGTLKPNMPNVESFIQKGVRFSNLWSYPTCTPTRSSILTGKYGFRTNVLNVDDVLSTSELSIQKYIDQQTNEAYSHAVIGKWHLSRDANHPSNMGIGYYAGFLNGSVKSYWDWDFTANGQTNNSTEYTTTKFTDLAINWTNEQTKPWFLWLAYNAPHSPFHLPPSNMHSQGALPEDQNSIDANPLPYYLAMLEAMDFEIGRLLESFSEMELSNTIIIFIGDNGSPSQVAQEYNSRRVKGTVYQGGINVPMIISGNGVERMNEMDEALINTTDLFITISNLAGINVDTYEDSENFAPLLKSNSLDTRDYVYSEIGESNDGKNVTIRNATHKYILFEDGTEALFDLRSNPFEKPNLLSASQLPLNSVDSIAYKFLIEEMDKLLK